MVLVYSDHTNLTCELLAKASELGKQRNEKVETVFIGNVDDAKANQVIACGADTVYLVSYNSTVSKAEE